MMIYIGKNYSEPTQVTKQIVYELSLEGTLRDETDLLNPVFTIEQALDNVSLCNYVQIPAFQRNYFITGMRSIRTHLVEISCHVDVLSTYAEQIKKLPAIVDRQESVWNFYLNDPQIKTVVDDEFQTLSFPSSLTDTFRYLMVVQGAASVPQPSSSSSSSSGT